MAWRCLRCEHATTEYLRPSFCGGCGTPDTYLPDGEGGEPTATDGAPPLCLAEHPAELPRLRTRERALDRLTGGGFPAGCTVSCYGLAGAGKSTLLYRWASLLGPALLVCPEMSFSMLQATAKRGGGRLAHLHLSQADDWRADAERVGARAVVIDSISRVLRPATELRRLVDWAAASGGVGFAIAHRAKDGSMLGPVSLRHDPDACFRFEPRAGGKCRVRVLKSRFCPVGSADFSLLPSSPPAPARLRRVK